MLDILDRQQPPRRDRRLLFLVLAILAIVILFRPRGLFTNARRTVFE